MFFGSDAADILLPVERPLCPCHGEPMRSCGPKAKTPWRCAVKKRESQKSFDRKRDPIRNKKPRRQLQQRVAARNRETAKDLELVEKLRHQLLGGTE